MNEPEISWEEKLYKDRINALSLALLGKEEFPQEVKKEQKEAVDSQIRYKELDNEYYKVQRRV